MLQRRMRIAMANTHAELRHQLCSLLLRAIIELHDLGMSVPNRVQEILDKIVLSCRDPYPFVRDNAVQADYILFNRAKYALQVRTAKEMLKSVIGHVVRLGSNASLDTGFDESNSKPPIIYECLFGNL